LTAAARGITFDPMRNPLRMVKLLVAVGRLARDLKRLEKVFEINEQIVAMRTPADEAATVADFARHSAGASALRSRPRLGRLDLDTLRTLPETSLGGAYVRFLDRNGITPESLPDIADANDMDYILAHFYETHDLWHVLTGFDADPAGEVGVQAFLLAQYRAFLPFFVISAVLVNTALYSYEDKVRRLDAIARGWQLGRSSSSIVGVDWRPHLEAPLTDVRRQFRLAS
jgi:ubiquinone biosynthesis protein COQ4